MIKKLLIIFLLCYLPFLGRAQTVSIEFNGVIHTLNDSTDLLENVEIFLIKGVDTIEVLESNANGAYSWTSELSVGDEITLTAKRQFFSSRSVQFTVPHYSTIVELNFELTEFLIDRPNTPIYDKNSTDQFTGFDVDLMKYQLRKFEHFCIEFRHVTYCNERDEIAEQRMTNFRQYLIDHTIDIGNFSFNTENSRLDCNTDDCRGRIEGKMLSVEEKCD